MIAVCLYLTIGQTMASRGDVLMRPIIPDPFLVRQAWAMRDLGLSQAERTAIEAEARLSPEAIRLVSRTGHLPATPILLEINNSRQKRIKELSIWANDLHALTDPITAKLVGLTDKQRQAVDAEFRAYFQWQKDELKRLSSIKRTRAEFRTQMPTLDQHAAQARMIVVRKKVRNLLTPAQVSTFRTIKGSAPATIGPFGWPSCAPSIFLYDSDYIISSQRVQEELGFTMKQSRLLGERLGAGSTPQAETARLSVSQRALMAKLGIQKQGPMSILRCDVSDRLGLDEGLRDKIILRVANFEREDMNLQHGNGNIDQRRQVWERKEAMILSYLTPGQLNQWKLMQGPKLPGLEPIRP